MSLTTPEYAFLLPGFLLLKRSTFDASTTRAAPPPPDIMSHHARAQAMYDYAVAAFLSPGKVSTAKPGSDADADADADQAHDAKHTRTLARDGADETKKHTKEALAPFQELPAGE